MTEDERIAVLETKVAELEGLIGRLKEVRRIRAAQNYMKCLQVYGERDGAHESVTDRRSDDDKND